VAVGVCAIWRSRAPYDLKAGALTAGALLATPYLFVYDLVVLAVALAFLLRLALAHGFLRGEPFSIAVVFALILSYVVVATPVGLAATVIVALMIARRALTSLREPAS